MDNSPIHKKLGAPSAALLKLLTALCTIAMFSNICLAFRYLLNYYIPMTQKQDFFSMMGGRVEFYRGMYNPTSDAVWLAAMAPDAKHVLDVGVGTGGVALCYLANHPDASVTGIDVSPDMLAAAARNAERNNRHIILTHADITTWRTDETFDLVMTNPPYFKGTPAKHNAHHNADLDIWTRRCLARVRPNGIFCTVVDAGVGADIIAIMQKRCGDITLFPLFGGTNTAERLVIRGKLGSRGPMRVYAGLSMNDERILRDGLTIDDIFTKLASKC